MCVLMRVRIGPPTARSWMDAIRPHARELRAEVKAGDMIRSLLRFLRFGAADTPVGDVPSMRALARLADEVEPDADLFAKIEARIDAEEARQPRRQRFARIRQIALLLGFALSAAFAGSQIGPERQHITARPSATADWVPLGSVTLHGPALQAFVRSKCAGHTHFYITMHGVTLETPGASPGSGTALAAPDEKILMECIF